MNKFQSITTLAIFGALILLAKVVEPLSLLADEQGRAEDQDAANVQVHQLSVADDACGLQFHGNQHIVCKSRWHDIRLPCTIRGSMSLTNDDLNLLLPDDKVPVGKKWQIDEKLSAALAKRLFEAIKITSADAQAYDKWTGSDPQMRSVECESQISGILRDVEVKGQSGVAKIGLTGDLRIVESGKMAGRFGPNWWKSNWRLNLEMEIEVNLVDKKLNALRFAAKGSIAGEYSNQGNPDLREPFTAEVDFQTRPPNQLSPRQLLRVQKLIESLGDDSFAERERATKELRQLGSEVSHHLRTFALTAKDAEVRFRLTMLANELEE